MRAPLKRLRAADKLPAKKGICRDAACEHKGAKPRILCRKIKLVQQVFTTVALNEAAMSAAGTSSPACLRLWTRLRTCVFRPEKL